MDLHLLSTIIVAVDVKPRPRGTAQAPFVGSVAFGPSFSARARTPKGSC